MSLRKRAPPPSLGVPFGGTPAGSSLRRARSGTSCAMEYAQDPAEVSTRSPASRDLHDPRLLLLEARGHGGVVARDDEAGLARELVDGLEGVEHLGQARDDLDGLAILDVVVEVRGVRGEDHGPPRRLHA